MRNLGFTCNYGNYAHLFVPSPENTNAINITGGAQITPTNATYDPNTGVLELTVNNSLNAATSHTVGGALYAPATGLLTITLTNHNFANGSYVRFDKDSLTFTCAKDSNATQHKYPRITDPVYNKWIPITVVDANTFTVDVGISEDTFSHTFVSAVTNGLKKANSSITIDPASL